ncbi:MAG: ribonuclease III [Holosporaceae bacterium]|jgi:ribonuclease-3|nr:ribonuclease III [Holosporaceae bacterium]
MSALSVAKLQEIISYEFKNKNSVAIALSHPGLKRGNKTSARDFERLEFLGDRVLGLSLSSFLYDRFPADSEGDLALRISILAGTDFLINMAKKTGIIDCFSIPSDFFVSGNKNSSSIADMMEAVFGAVFLDSDFETAKGIVLNLCKDDVDDAVYKKKDAKTQLQEISQSKFQKLPVYRLIKTTGEAHNPVFEMEVAVGEMSAAGRGHSRKSAEHAAAAKLMEKLGG